MRVMTAPAECRGSYGAVGAWGLQPSRAASGPLCIAALASHSPSWASASAASSVREPLTAWAVMKPMGVRSAGATRGRATSAPCPASAA